MSQDAHTSHDCFATEPDRSSGDDGSPEIELIAYYRSSTVRSRIAEYCNGEPEDSHSSSRLVHIQASDNRGHTDDHLPPGEGIIDWPKVQSKLAAIGYRGVFLLELTGNGDIREHVAHAARRAHQTLSVA
jgi:hypothetical protein